MKKLIFISLIFAFVACGKDDESIVKHDIMIRGEQPTKASSTYQLKSTTVTHLTAQQIAKQAHSMEGKYMDGYYEGSAWSGSGFDITQRDTVNGILIRWASDILSADHNLEMSFIMSENIVFVRYTGEYPNYGEGDQHLRDHLDTIAYIPNSVITEAKNLILEAYEDERWQDIYDIFNDKFKFIPITGSEYRELQGQGLN